MFIGNKDMKNYFIYIFSWKMFIFNLYFIRWVVLKAFGHFPGKFCDGHIRYLIYIYKYIK